MRSYVIVVKFANKLLNLVSVAINKQKAKKRNREYEQIKKNPEDYHSELFGESSGSVSVDTNTDD